MLHSLKRSSRRLPVACSEAIYSLRICRSQGRSADLSTFTNPKPTHSPTSSRRIHIGGSPLSDFRIPTQKDPTERLDQYNSRIAEAVRSNQFPRAFEVAAEMKSQAIRPNLATYHHLMYGCSKAALTVEAWAIIDDMEALNIKPDVHIFNLLITTLRATATSSVWKAFRLMEDSGVLPDSETYTRIIHRYVENENLEMCLMLLDKMREDKVALTLDPMIRITSLAARMGCPRLALDLAASFEATAGQRLGQEVWMLCLQCSAQEQYKDAVLHAWDIVTKEYKVIPDEGTCLEVLNAAARHKLPGLAHSVIDALKEMNTSLQEFHLAPLVEANCTDGHLEDAFDTLSDMRQHKLKPTLSTVYPIVQFARQSPENIDLAWKIVEGMHKKGKDVDILALNSVLQAGAEMGDMSRVVMIYNAFPEFKIAPDIDTFNLLLRACIVTQRREMADRFLGDLKTASVKPDMKTFGYMIRLCLTQDIYEDAFYYLEESKASGFQPDYRTYVALAHKCARNSDLRLRVVLEEMEEAGMVLDDRSEKYIEEARITAQQERNATVPGPFQPLDERAQQMIESGGL